MNIHEEISTAFNNPSQFTCWKNPELRVWAFYFFCFTFFLLFLLFSLLASFHLPSLSQLVDKRTWGLETNQTSFQDLVHLLFTHFVLRKMVNFLKDSVFPSCKESNNPGQSNFHLSDFVSGKFLTVTSCYELNVVIIIMFFF